MGDERLGRCSLFAVRSPGFTLIELLVVMAITAILTTVVAVNFQTVRARQELTSAQSDFISKLRELQSFILAGKNQGSAPAASYRVQFATGQNMLPIEYDPSGSPVTFLPLENFIYSSVTSNVSVTNLWINGTPVASASLLINAPFGTIQIEGAANAILEIQLGLSGSGFSKNIVIDGISGRISAP
ncbi:MAG: hypothetical protein A2751_00195 [Candidatus Doudnabacteria bacterium RIFCSPHIGHO2_01_FULL_46_14]|uniref:General secretion pathway GspH domain-containing protein n=1 Tax=Candidatus Doudnabacteria bacterium RIFCSPHIGHO2_01_FULL_46_14 TaxID=1817824 RepID=A0A1F5NMP0_9BACT|nr:MAG: hypothetical protein A2751_00195 [Candidatus Doudnabacteria bacterium RIFCSPHIGHO2_01_FULL_46_14]